jgi:hypothetical protein
MQKKIQEANGHLEQKQMFLDRLVDQQNKLSNAIQQAKMEVAAQMGFIDALNRTMEEFFPEASPSSLFIRFPISRSQMSRKM